MKWYRYETVDSTNTEARRLIRSGSFTAPAVILATQQTAGRGRQGRSFYSPAHTGIYMSIVLPLQEQSPDTALLTVRASVAVADAIREETGLEPGIKWVNDLYLGTRKICGILTESVAHEASRYAILGIGINVTTSVFPAEFAEKAGSIGAVGTGCMASLPCTVLKHVLRAPTEYADLLEEYRKRSIVLGREVTYERAGILYTGRAAEIAPDGALLIDLGGGKRDLLRSGEISLRTWTETVQSRS